MYTEAAMRKALGKKRWEKVEDYSYSCGVIDIMFLKPWKNVSYDCTIYVCEPDANDMTRNEVINDIKYFIDGMEECEEGNW